MSDSSQQDVGGGKSEGATATVDRASKGQRSGDPSAGRNAASGGSGPSGGQSFFEMYKPGQGYYTRMGTAIGAGLLTLAGGNFLYDQITFSSDAAWTLWLKIGIPFVIVAAIGFVIWWVVGVNRGSCDFFIATESEMKKVSWSSRNELIGSTKVVIIFTLLLALILFLADFVFIWFFTLIKVLGSGS